MCHHLVNRKASFCIIKIDSTICKLALSKRKATKLKKENGSKGSRKKSQKKLKIPEGKNRERGKFSTIPIQIEKKIHWYNSFVVSEKTGRKKSRKTQAGKIPVSAEIFPKFASGISNATSQRTTPSIPVLNTVKAFPSWSRAQKLLFSTLPLVHTIRRNLLRSGFQIYTNSRTQRKKEEDLNMIDCRNNSKILSNASID